MPRTAKFPMKCPEVSHVSYPSFGYFDNTTVQLHMAPRSTYKLFITLKLCQEPVSPTGQPTGQPTRQAQITILHTSLDVSLFKLDFSHCSFRCEGCYHSRCCDGWRGATLIVSGADVNSITV